MATTPISTILAALLLLAPAAPALSQWLTLKTPNIPRHADGSPNLTAAPPRLADGHPDLQGIWTNGRGNFITAPEALLQAWALTMMAARQQNFRKDRPGYRCLPNGPEINPEWKQIIQTPATIAVINDDLTSRLIFLDGRMLESEPHPTWMGYSVARWDGDTLVVESNGFNDKTWLNVMGLPHTEQLRLTERYTRSTFGQMQLDLTIQDPGAFTAPWTASVTMNLQVDEPMLERVCETNSDNYIGTMSDVRADIVSVAPDILARYVGVYSGVWGERPRTMRVRLVDGILHANGPQGADIELFPLSDTSFQGTNGLPYIFEGSETGQATSIMERHVSGDYTYARER